MAVTTNFLTRGYAGAAQPVSLVANLPATQTSGTIAVTDLTGAGWTKVATSLQGTSGVFCVVIDYNLATEEKILCSAIDLVGNTLTIYNDGTNSGRGYDGTSAYTHTAPATTTTGNIFPVFTAQEAAESNYAAIATSQLYINSGTSTAPGDTVVGGTALFGYSKYTAAADHAHNLPVATIANGTVNALKRGYINVARNAAWSTAAAASPGTVLPFDTVQISGNGFSSSSLGTSTNAGKITVPVTGIYRVSGAVQVSGGSSGSMAIGLVNQSSSTVLAFGSQIGNDGQNKILNISCLVSLASNTVISLNLIGANGGAVVSNPGDLTKAYFSVEFASVA